MLERLSRKNINRKHPDYIVFAMHGIVVILCISIVVAHSFSTNTQQSIRPLNQPSPSSVLIASWNANQTKLNNDIISDVKATGSKIVNGTISSGTTITTTRDDFLSHLSNKTVVYTSFGDVISLGTIDARDTEIRLTKPLSYAVIVDGVTYTISVNDCRYSLMKLKNKSLIDVIWINENYWWG